jgi:hypothetical protein
MASALAEDSLCERDMQISSAHPITANILDFGGFDNKIRKKYVYS